MLDDRPPRRYEHSSRDDHRAINIVLLPAEIGLAQRRLVERGSQECVGSHRLSEEDEAVRVNLTADEVGFYRENGFVVFPEFLEPDELALWREVVDAAVAERGEARFAGPTTFDERPEQDEEAEAQAEYARKVLRQHVNLWQTNKNVRTLMFDERLGKLAAELAGVEGIRIWHDQALSKSPYAAFTAYHLDLPYWSFTSPDAISLWVALDDATLENGCLYYIPGSHKAEKYDNVPIGKDLGALFNVYPQWRQIEPVACPVPAGGACLHNGLTAHGAGANMTHGWRRAMTCAYMPDGSTFNGQPNVLPPSYLATLEVGDVLNDDVHNPLVYSRSGEPAGRPSTVVA
jgi:phytanoyl-CoA hydroxylase